MQLVAAGNITISNYRFSRPLVLWQVVRHNYSVMQDIHLTSEHRMFQEAARAFCEQEIAPHIEDWEKDGIISRDAWLKAGEQGFLCMDFPEEHGGLAAKDFRFNALFNEELTRIGCAGSGFALQNDVTAPYFLEMCNAEQQARFMPGMITGETIAALAITEPGTGSDIKDVNTRAERDGDYYVVNGAKTFITNGILSDVVVTVVKTDPDAGHKGISLLLVERGMDGFTRGTNLDKLGLKMQDTAELSFSDLRVPVENLVGQEGKGFYYLMHNLAQERTSIAVGSISNAEAALAETMRYCNERTAFGRQIGKFQNSRFKLAEMQTEITIGRTFVDQCVLELNAGTLTTEKAAMAKMWCSEMEWRVVDQCLQLHGGYGYMEEYPLAKRMRDARVQRIYGGTNEIMREIVGRSMGF